MTFGVTPDGFRKKTFDDVYTSIVDAVHAVPFLSTLSLTRDTFLGGVVGIVATAYAEGWDVLQGVYNAFDPDGATGRPLDNLSTITGTRRLAATQTLVRADVNVDAGTYGPGSLVAYVLGHPERRFYNRDTVVNPGPGVTDIPTTMLCETFGPVPCPVTSLAIASPVAGWNGVNNFSEGVLGLDIETDSELRTRREAELAAEGGSTVDAIVADMQKDSRIVKCYVFHNVQDTPQVVSGSLMPPHSLEAVVYDGTLDGSGLTDQEIADRLWKSAPGGIRTVGLITRTVTAADGQSHDISFSRPTAVDVFVTIVVTPTVGWDGGGSPPVVKRAVVDYARRHYTVGSDVYRAFLYTPVTSVVGVLNVPTLTIGLSFPGAAADIDLTNRQIARFTTANIHVNGV